MTKLKRWLSLMCCAVLCGGCAASPTPTDSSAHAETPTAPTTAATTAATTAPLPAVADVTVMSWNILNPAWGGTPASERIGIIADTLDSEAPDVIGFQEVGPRWHEQWDTLPDRYAVVDKETDAGVGYMTLLMYNTDTLTLIDHGVEDLDAGSDIRVVAWARFAVNGTDASFLITNTHPHSSEAQCLVHTQAYLKIVNDLRRRFDLPLISVGDFNAVENSAAYRLHLGDGFTDSKYADGVTVLDDKDSYLAGDFGGAVTTGKGSRDHIFFKGRVTPRTFTTLHENGIRDASDHLPVVAKLTIG